MMEPVLYHHNTISITSKPLPALLAPPQGGSSIGSFFSSTTSSSDDPAYIQHTPSSTAYCTVTQKQSLEIQHLRQALLDLNQKYMNQINRMQVAEQAQFQVESELEDLSLQLFEQANSMVAEEKKARFFAEKKIATLESELKAMYEELGNERAQLNELRERLFLSEAAPMDSPTITHHDEGWASVFKDFVLLAPNTPLESIHRLPFLKQCLDLDIEPCLRFRRLTMKKVLDAVMRQPCFIESYHPQKRHSHDDSTIIAQPSVRRSSFPFINKLRSQQETCYACGNTLIGQQFKFKLKEQDVECVWIDRACRDRLVAVCNFYVFIRHVRLGLQRQRSIQSLFQESVWLRLAMFWARSGIYHD